MPYGATLMPSRVQQFAAEKTGVTQLAATFALSSSRKTIYFAIAPSLSLPDRPDEFDDGLLTAARNSTAQWETSSARAPA